MERSVEIPALPALERDVFASRLWAAPAYALFFLMLFAPTVFKPLKIGILIVVLVIVGAAVLRRGGFLGLHPTVLFWTGLLTALGLFFVIRGVVRGHPGALPQMTVFVLWPWLYAAFTAGASREWLLRGLLKVMVVALIAIDLYTIVFFLRTMGMWPADLFFELRGDQAIAFYSGFVEYRLPSLDTLVFVVPFAIAALFTWPRKWDAMPVARVWLWVGVVLGLGLVLLSGRRALQLVVALSPVFIIAFRSFLPERRAVTTRRVMIASAVALVAVSIGVFTYLQTTYGISLEGMKQMFLTGFDWQNDESASIRVSQFFGLMEAWMAQPILGSGAGADVGATRVAFEPWSYELEYFAILAHMGLVGFTLYAAGIAWIFYRAVKLIKQGSTLSLYMVPVMVGTSCFLIASGVNQYLLKYDFIWTIFLPIMVLNFALLQHETSGHPDE